MSSPSTTYTVICRICTSHIDPAQETDQISKLHCGHVFHTLCIEDRLATSDLTGVVSCCPICSVEFRQTDVKRVFIDSVETTRGESAQAQDPISPLPEYVLAALNRRLEGLRDEQRATSLQTTLVLEQVNAAERERESLRAYHDHITAMNIDVERRINDLVSQRAELQRKLKYGIDY